jgi:hypothetical protein
VAKADRSDVRQAAEIVGIQALSFLAGEPARLGRFLAETGLGPENLRAAAKSPDFLLAVIDFLLKDAAMVEEFAAASELPLETITAARIALGGSDWERSEA